MNRTVPVGSTSNMRQRQLQAKNAENYVPIFMALLPFNVAG